MSAVVVAVIAENVVILAAIGARWSLLRQGGGLQEKTPSVPKAPAQPKRDAAAKVSGAAEDEEPRSILLGRAG